MGGIFIGGGSHSRLRASDALAIAPRPCYREAMPQPPTTSPTDPLVPSARRALHTLDIGCGASKLAGAIGIDRLPRLEVDIVHDLDVTPWPLAADSFDHVRALDVLEHVDDFVAVVNEMWRVCKPDATVEVRMPFMGSVHHHTDPTHRRGATHRTFDYFDPSTTLGRFGYSAAQFTLTRFEYLEGHTPDRVGRLYARVGRLVVPWLQRHADTYERYGTGIFPLTDIRFELVARK